VIPVNSEFTIAVHSLVFLAYLPDHMASSQKIARNVSTNPARIRKIMSCLRNHGFVKTKEGIGGGYILQGDPDEITLGQIYRSVSCGTIKPNWCSGDPEEACVVSSNIQIVMDDMFEEADQYLSVYLDKISIASVLKKIKQCQ
jgi:Rrf2 family protein